MPEIKSCPYCGAVAEMYDGDYQIKHKEGCWILVVQGQEVTWIMSTRGGEMWNKRVGQEEELKHALNEIKELEAEVKMYREDEGG